MRATSTIVVFSSLLLAASVAAGPNGRSDSKKKAPAATTGSAAKKPGTASTSSAGASGASAGSAAPAAGGSTASGSGSAAASGSGAPADGAGAAGSAAASGSAAGGPPPAAPATDLAAVRPEDMPTAVRMRRLEQKTQALKERAWQLKARVQLLKEQMLGGGVGAQAVIAHANDMGASFRLIKLIYSLDGTQVFARTDDTAESLYKARSFDVFSGPISPGNHTLSSIATYRGHGYGVFEYLSKYTFTAKGSQSFLAGEGKIAKVDCRGYEKGGPTTPLEKRAAIDCKVTQVQPAKPAEPGAVKPAEPNAARPAEPDAAGPGATSGPAPSSPSPSPSSPAPAPPPAATPAPSTAPAPGGTTQPHQPGK